MELSRPGGGGIVCRLFAEADALLRRICAWRGERIPAGHAFDTRAGDLKACGPTCCDRINDSHGA